VRSSKAARLKRIKPGFYNPPGGRPVFVPGFEWLCVSIAGLLTSSGPARVAVMRWWSRRGGKGVEATDARTEQTKVLAYCAKEWRRRVVHIFDRGYAGHPWVNLLLYWSVRFVLRWPKHYKLQLRRDPAPPTERRGEETPAWQIARGKLSWDKKQVYDTHTKDRRTIGILALPVWHPGQTSPLWLVVARSGHGREPWYLLTSDPMDTKKQAWQCYFSYHRRWQVEMSFRYNKSELAMESPRLQTWEGRMKLLGIVALVYAYLVQLLDPAMHAFVVEVIRRCCHRTGKRGRDTSAPLYRLRAAISRLLAGHPQTTAQTSLQNSG
jgi:hypothetical protein